MTALADTEIDRVLVVVAHPDDAEFAAGGTIASWTSSGIEVAYCLATRGEAGGFDPELPREAMPPIREAEQRAAATVVGVTDVTFLDGQVDGQVTPSYALRGEIARVIRRFRPQRLVCPSPERNYKRIHASHPDHQAVGEAALCAVYPDARNPFAHPQLLADGLQPWTVAEVWIAGGPAPDHSVDVTDTFDKKVAALREHRSQTSHMDDLEDMVRTWLSAGALLGGLPQGRLAESFQVISTG